ncbi:MAG: TetR/AcrR family transcriptional regulator [Pirellulales bacterium]
MRITAEEKSATRQRILDAAIQAFRKRGFEATTTRDIATAAGIATGTLFNYFATKEAIVEFLAAEALARARSRFDWEVSTGGLEESLFAYVAAELRQLKPLRKFITPLLETSLCPLAVARPSDSNHGLRVEHMETVAGLAGKHGFAVLSAVSLQVYWTLYIGVLAFWAADKSPKQEDTLALLDQSLTMFVAWLRGEHSKAP